MLGAEFAIPKKNCPKASFFLVAKEDDIILSCPIRVLSAGSVRILPKLLQISISNGAPQTRDSKVMAPQPSNRHDKKHAVPEDRD
jgi:hypothetical protein